MMVPSVHLNGTSKDELLAQLSRVTSAADELLQALAQAAPNGRDYYPQGEDAITKAIAQHAVRVAAVRSVMHDMVNMAVAVDDGGYKVPEAP